MKRFLMAFGIIVGLSLFPSLVFGADLIADLDAAASGNQRNKDLGNVVGGTPIDFVSDVFYQGGPATITSVSFSATTLPSFVTGATGGTATRLSGTGESSRIDSTISVIPPCTLGTFGNATGGGANAGAHVRYSATGYIGPAGQVIGNSGAFVNIQGNVTSLGPNCIVPPTDTTAPVVTCTVPDQTIWYADNVTVNCTATDAGSPPAVPASFSLSTTVASGNEDAAAETGTQQVCDSATTPNCVTAGPYTFMVDRKSPTVTCESPAPTFVLNQANATVSATVTDGGSGPANSPISAAADTTSVGSSSVELTGYDNVGNSTPVSCSYSVVYAICILYDQAKAHKSGSTVPIKIALCDSSGVFVSDESVIVHATSLQKLDSAVYGTVEDSGAANPDNDFRFSADLDGYIFNLSTRTPSPALGAGTTKLGLGTWKLNFSVDGASDPSYYQLFDVK